jgi:MFS family permease
VLLWELLWGFGNACTSSAIFVPFLSQLAGSKRLVGTVGLATLLGIPALFVSLWLGHRLRRRRVAVTLLWTAQVVGWVVLGVVLTREGPPSPSIVPVIYVTQAALAFLGGVSMAPTYQLLTSAFGDRFGTAQGLQLLFRQISGVLGGLWAATALEREAFPRNFGTTFLIGGIVLTTSNVAVLFVVEETNAEAERAREEAPPFLPALGRTLREARPVMSFLWVIAGVACAVSAQSLLVVSALERLHLGAGYAGVFASVTLAAQGIGGVIAGRTGDRIGHARALFASLGVQLVAFALSAILLGLGQFYVALTLAGLANAAMQIGLSGLTARLAPPSSQGAFVAMMRWVVQIVSAVATAAAAFVADRAGYAVLFLSFLAPVVAAMFVVQTLARRERER